MLQMHPLSPARPAAHACIGEPRRQAKSSSAGGSAVACRRRCRRSRTTNLCTSDCGRTLVKAIGAANGRLSRRVSRKWLLITAAEPGEKNPAGCNACGVGTEIDVVADTDYGRMTASMTWITPFFALMSVLMTLASPVVVPTFTPPSVDTLTTLPPAVLASVSFTTSAA